MTRAEFAVILAKISRFYPRFYEGQDASKVAEDWYKEGGFEFIAFGLVERAVRAYCNTAKFPPTLADIKAQMVESYLQDKPTAMQAFLRISSAVKKATNRDEAIRQYNELPPILRKLVEKPSVLSDWNSVSTESFQTVIMSAVRESYKELTTREAKYYAFPDDLRQAEQWRIGTPDLVALPEPEKVKTYDEMLDDMTKNEVAYRERYGIKPNADYEDAVIEFKKPLTKEDYQRVEDREKLKAEWSL